jgi:hypothetical protein
VQIKAQGLLNAAKWIEEEYGRDSLGLVVRACSPEVRERYMSAIAINWHPMEELVEFVETADRMLGRGNGKLAENIGAAGARANMKGVVARMALYLAQPQFFIRRVAGLRSQFNDEGEMLVNHLDDRYGQLEIRGVTTPHPIFCGVLTGWIRELATGMGIITPAVRHTQCVCRGEGHCYWDVRWVTLRDQNPSSGQIKAASSGQLHVAVAVKEPPGRDPPIEPPPPSAPPPSSGHVFPPSSGTLPATTPVGSSKDKSPPHPNPGAARTSEARAGSLRPSRRRPSSRPA